MIEMMLTGGFMSGVKIKSYQTIQRFRVESGFSGSTQVPISPVDSSQSIITNFYSLSGSNTRGLWPTDIEDEYVLCTKQGHIGTLYAGFSVIEFSGAKEIRRTLVPPKSTSFLNDRFLGPFDDPTKVLCFVQSVGDPRTGDDMDSRFIITGLGAIEEEGVGYTRPTHTSNDSAPYVLIQAVIFK